MDFPAVLIGKQEALKTEGREGLVRQPQTVGIPKLVTTSVRTGEKEGFSHTVDEILILPVLLLQTVAEDHKGQPPVNDHPRLFVGQIPKLRPVEFKGKG